jgi:hypothetical protein
MGQNVKVSTNPTEYSADGNPIVSKCHGAKGERRNRHYFCPACDKRIRTPKK